jgi:hypothetical protein
MNYFRSEQIEVVKIYVVLMTTTMNIKIFIEYIHVCP